MQPPNVQNPAIWSPQTLVNKPRRRFRCKMIELDLPRCQDTKTHQKTMVSDTSGMHPPQMQHDSSNQKLHKNSFLFIPKNNLDNYIKSTWQRVRPTKKNKDTYKYNIYNMICYMIVTFKRSSIIIRFFWVSRAQIPGSRTLQLKRLQWGPVESNMSVQKNMSQQKISTKKMEKTWGRWLSDAGNVIW